MSKDLPTAKLTLSDYQIVSKYADFEIISYNDKSIKVFYNDTKLTRELRREKSQATFIYFKCKFHRSFLSCKAFIRANLVGGKIVFSSNKAHNDSCLQYGDHNDLTKIKKIISKELPENSNLVTNKTEFCLMDCSYPCHTIKLKKRIVREKKISGIDKEKSEMKIPTAKCRFCQLEFRDLSYVNMGKCNHKYHFLCLLDLFWKSQELQCSHCLSSDTLFSKSVNFESLGTKLNELSQETL